MEQAWTNSEDLIVVGANGLVPLCRCNPCMTWDIRAVCRYTWSECAPCQELSDCRVDFAFLDSDDGCTTKISVSPETVVDYLHFYDFNAPYACTYGFRVDLNGSEIYSEGGLEAEANQAITDVKYRHNATVATGFHKFDFHVDFTAGTETETWTRSICFFVYNAFAGGAPSLLSVRAVPSNMVDCIDESYSWVKLLGPYNSKEEAQWVIGGSDQPVGWDEAIQNYAQNCICTTTACGVGEIDGADWDYPGDWDLNLDPGGSGYGIPSCPWTTLVRFTITGGDFNGGVVKFLNYCETPPAVIASMSEPGTTIVEIPPCIDLRIKIIGADGAGWITASVEDLTGMPPGDDCNQDIIDAFEAVPKDSTELEYYIGVARAACELDGGTWNESLFMCEMPEA